MKAMNQILAATAVIGLTALAANANPSTVAPAAPAAPAAAAQDHSAPVVDSKATAGKTETAPGTVVAKGKRHKKGGKKE